MEKEKMARLNELIMKIELGVNSGKIVEKESDSEFPCKYCVFHMGCYSSRLMPCMAHNRKDKKSIYYSYSR
jgi:hypothetical protein